MKIERLEIFTINLRQQLEFYEDVLCLEISFRTQDYFEVEVGYSILKFTQSQNATPYHIAFHIPVKHEECALNWIKSKVPVLKNSNEEIINFGNWNARSVYFYDLDKNILEFISRRNLCLPSNSIFSEKNILGIAEIGLATTNIELIYRQFQEISEIKIYDGNFDKFCALGDDQGLIITINKDLKTWFPTGDKAYASNFIINFIQDFKKYEFKYSDGKLQNIN